MDLFANCSPCVVVTLLTGSSLAAYTFFEWHVKVKCMDGALTKCLFAILQKNEIHS